MIYCLDLYQQLKAKDAEAGQGDVTASIEGHLRKTSLVPVISDFLFADAQRVLNELSLLNGMHDVFLMMADVRFAYELPPASAGWIETFDVETGSTRVVSRRELARLASRVEQWQEQVMAHGAGRGSRHRARRPGSMGNGNDARGVRARAAAAQVQLRVT